IALLETHFRDRDRGGYFFTPDDGESLIIRTKSGADGALPSGSAVAALVHSRLHALTGDDGHHERAEELRRLYHHAAAEQPFAYATYLQALEHYVDTPIEIVIVGDPDAGDTRSMWNVVRGRYLPNRVLVRTAPDNPKLLALARDRPAIDDRA